MATAVARRAHHLARVAERRPQALARHFQQAEARNTTDLNAGTVALERLAQPFLDLALVARRRHVDEIDDDEPADIAQSQLASHLVGGLEIGRQRGFLDIRALGGPRRVDVDAHQRLGVVDDQ